MITKALNFIKKNHGQTTSFLLLLAFYAFLLANPIDLTNSDLGRHLTNGREILAGNWAVLHENYYSHTLPHQKFINHHWLSGVIFYGVENLMGSKVLQIFHGGILVGAFAILYKLMKKMGSWQSANIASLPVILFLSGRLEIRPESFGYLFIAICLWGCFQIIETRKISKKWVAWLLFQQLLWVNLHISFIFGWIVMGGLWLSSFVLKSPKLPTQTLKNLGGAIVGIIAVSFFNPNFLDGLIAPFSLFTNYGYRVVENQTLWFLHSRINNPIIGLYALLAPITIGLLIIFHKKINYFWQIFSWIGLGLGFMALRNIPILIFLSMPFFSWATHQVLIKIKKYIQPENPHQSYLTFFVSLYVGLVIFVASGNLKPSITWKNRSLGFSKIQVESILKIKNVLEKNNVTGQIFNNYDLGSYLIYGLHPEWPVFVDNRPEAYNVKFFQDIYVPMQESEVIWQEQLKKHDFQAIVFGYHDITPWAQTFLKNRWSDPIWENVYQDERIVVLIKREI